MKTEWARSQSFGGAIIDAAQFSYDDDDDLSRGKTHVSNLEPLC